MQKNALRPGLHASFKFLLLTLLVSLSASYHSNAQVYRHGFTNSNTDLPGIKSERITSSSWSAPAGTLTFFTSEGNVLLSNKGHLHQYKLTLSLEKLYQLEITSISFDKLSGDQATMQIKVNGDNYASSSGSTATLSGTTRTKTVSNLRGQVEIEILVANTNVANNNFSRLDDFVINGTFSAYEELGPDIKGILYVKSQAGSGTGSSWEKALNQVYDALEIARNNPAVKQIWVQAGNFSPQSNGQSFSLINGVKVFGGFTGTESSLGERIVTPVTVTKLVGRGAPVVENSNLDNTTVLDGFEIRQGTGKSFSGGIKRGGGIYNSSASPVIRNCIFTENTLTSCTTCTGAGMYNLNSNPVITQCLFYYNQLNIQNQPLSNQGSALANINSSPVITNCTLMRNYIYGGGAVYNEGSSSPTVRNTIIWSNGTQNDPLYQTAIYDHPALTGNPAVTYSLIDGGYSGGDHLIDGDPYFSTYLQGPYTTKLEYNSKAIGAGDPNTDLTLFASDEGSAQKDLDNKNRVFDGRIDLGVFEIKGTDTWHVLASSTVANPDGLSWQSAFPTLQQALAVAIPRDEIWVGKGEYVATAGQSFQIPHEVVVYGGFNGNETTLSQRRFPAPRGMATGASILKGNGASVISDAGQNEQTFFLLDGLTITGGQAENGGGLYISKAKVRIVNCSIVGNSATGKGGGIYWASTPVSGEDPYVVKTSLISKNTASHGGGIYAAQNAFVIMSHCVLSENTASTAGGAFGGYSASLVNVTIVKNTAPVGGAIEIVAESPFGIASSIITGNSSGVVGISASDTSSPTTFSSIIQGIPESIGLLILSDNTDPMFKDFNGSDYSLTDCSPVINRGSNFLGGPIIPLDFAGNPSTYNKMQDMGAFEYQRIPRPATLPSNNEVVTTAWLGGVTAIVKDCKMFALVEPTQVDSLYGIFEVKSHVAPGQTLTDGQRVFVRRHLDISPDAFSVGSSANLTMFFTRAEFDDYNTAYGNAHNASLPENLKVVQYHGTSTTGLPSGYSGEMNINTNPEVSITADGQFYVVKFPITGLSGFFVTGQDESALPVTLISFEVSNKEDRAQLNWQTSTEMNSSYFDIEHSTNAKYWTIIGRVQAQGKSSVSQKYHYAHETPTGGTNLYRLKMTDLDGTYAYSTIRSVTFDQAQSLFLYPNPVVDAQDTNIKGLSAADIAQIQIYNTEGKSVFEKFNFDTNEMGISKLPPGAYAVRIKMKNGDLKSLKLMVGR